MRDALDPDEDHRMATHLFLIERFWPGVTPARANAATARLGRVAKCLDADGIGVRHLRSALLPADEVVWTVVEAGSRAAVIAVTERASYPVDRISETIPVGGRRR